MNLITEPITLPQVYNIPDDSITIRDNLVLLSRGVQAVQTTEQQERAANWGSSIQTLLAEVESARTSLTAPLLAAQRRLMELSKVYTEPLLAEKQRLGTLISAYQLAERARVQEEERKRQEELQRLERDRQAAIALAHEATLAAMKANDENQVVMDIQAAQATEQAEQAEQEIRMAIVQPMPEVVKATGAATRTKLAFRITDMKAFYAARPELCTEPEPKKSAINAVCKVTDKIPGIEFYEEILTNFRR